VAYVIQRVATYPIGSICCHLHRRHAHPNALKETNDSISFSCLPTASCKAVVWLCWYFRDGKYSL